VELVVERAEWEPPPEKFSPDSLVAVKIEGYVTDLRKQIKAAGGKWNPPETLVCTIRQHFRHIFRKAYICRYIE
jgi:hypothetical protein